MREIDTIQSVIIVFFIIGVWLFCTLFLNALKLGEESKISDVSKIEGHSTYKGTLTKIIFFMIHFVGMFIVLYIYYRLAQIIKNFKDVVFAVLIIINNTWRWFDMERTIRVTGTVKLL